MSGGAAEQDAERTKCTCLSTSYEFIPPLNHLAQLTTRDWSFYRSWAEATGDPREAIHLLQRLLVAHNVLMPWHFEMPLNSSRTITKLET